MSLLKIVCIRWIGARPVQGIEVVLSLGLGGVGVQIEDVTRSPSDKTIDVGLSR